MLGGSINTRNKILKKFRASKSTQLADDNLVGDDFAIQPDEMIIDGPTVNKLHTKEYRLLGDDDLDIRKKTIRQGRSVIMWFEIITSYKKPFIRYRLCNNDNTLTFEYVKIQSGEIPKMLGASYVGLHEFEETQYLFYCSDKETQEVNNITADDKYYYLLMDDIVNLKKYYGIPVADAVSKFFIKNDQFIFLVDEQDAIIEIPISGFRGEYYKKIGLLAGLGMPRSGPYASLGPHFYFGDFDRSLRFAAITLNGKSKEVMGEKLTIGNSPVFTKGGMVKYALFMGNSKVMLNLKHDIKDDSYESLILASKRKFIKDTLSLRDSAGKWAGQFDSVIQPELRILDRDLGIVRNLDPQFILKTFEQQVPLDYAYFKTDNITKNKETGFYNALEAIMI